MAIVLPWTTIGQIALAVIGVYAACMAIRWGVQVFTSQKKEG